MRYLLLALGVAASLFSALSSAQTSGVQRTVLERADLSVPGREALIVRVELAPGGSLARHSHPGEEIAYLLEGEGELLIEGAAPRHMKAGDTAIIPAGAIHEARNTGTTAIKLVAVFVVEKGKPLSLPAP